MTNTYKKKFRTLEPQFIGRVWNSKTPGTQKKCNIASVVLFTRLELVNGTKEEIELFNKSEDERQKEEVKCIDDNNKAFWDNYYKQKQQ
jgi:hypothetical protein